MRSLVSLLAVASVFTLVGCASSSSSKGAKTSSSGSGSGWPTRSMSEIEISPPKLMVAKKIERPLVMVLDPKQVADVQGPVKWGFNRYEITEFHLFVERDLKGAMETFFSDVRVVSAGEPLPDGPIVVADIRVDRLEAQIIGQVALAELTWAFALRPVESETYLFSYAGTSSSEPRRSAKKMVGSCLERAITDMVTAWTDKGVTQALRELGSPADLEATGESNAI